MKNTSKKGFTLVELVIVIAVIAILAAVLIPTFTSIIERANATSKLQTVKSQVDEAWVDFVADEHEVPTWVTVDSNGVVEFHTDNEYTTTGSGAPTAYAVSGSNVKVTTANKSQSVVIVFSNGGYMVNLVDTTTADDYAAPTGLTVANP